MSVIPYLHGQIAENFCQETRSCGSGKNCMGITLSLARSIEGDFEYRHN